MQQESQRVDKDGGDWIASITYRSEATTAPTASDLEKLVSRAKARNRRLGVTGMLLHDGGRFLQTLEGPPAALDEIWADVQRDPRHSEIEVLSHHIVPSRLFSGWDLQLYSRTSGRMSLTPSPAGNATPLVDHIPAIAHHALRGDDSKLNELIGDLLAQGWTSDPLITHLLEPTARSLGDAWLADDCTELDLTIGLSMLQLAGHAIHAGSCADTIRKQRYNILLATAPGESHILGPTLLGDIFTNAGWIVDMTFPDSNEALAKQLRAQRPDAVDIALSDALPREHAIATLRETIEKTRAATADDMMVVSVGGRLFAEASATALSVGADHARKGAAGTSVRLAWLIEQRRKTKPKA